MNEKLLLGIFVLLLGLLCLFLGLKKKSSMAGLKFRLIFSGIMATIVALIYIIELFIKS